MCQLSFVDLDGRSFRSPSPKDISIGRDAIYVSPLFISVSYLCLSLSFKSNISAFCRNHVSRYWEFADFLFVVCSIFESSRDEAVIAFSLDSFNANCSFSTSKSFIRAVISSKSLFPVFQTVFCSAVLPSPLTSDTARKNFRLGNNRQ